MYNLNEAARYALNNYMRFNDPNLHHIPYFYAFLDDGGSAAHHSEWDFGDATGRYLDALMLCGEVALNNDILDTANKYYEAIKWFVSLGANGLCYRPGGYDFCTRCVNTFDIRSALLGLAAYYRKTKNGEAAEIINAMIKGMVSIGVDMGDYFYLPYAYYTEDMPIVQKEYDIADCQADPCHYGGGVHLQPLMLYYEMTKDKSILDLCAKIVNFIVYKSGTFEDDGSFFVCGYFGGEDGHFHSRVSTALGALMYAVETNNEPLTEWCRKVYNFALSQGTSYGFFPEGLGRKPVSGFPEEYPETARHTEICGTTDMIELALLLSRGGYDLYDDAEKFANHLIKSQFININNFKGPDKHIAEKYRGAFLGRTMANDLLNNGRYDNMGCCAAAGGRGIWALWNNAVKYENCATTVELWLDCENNAGKIEFKPATGMGILKIKLKNNGVLKIRVPGFADLSDFQPDIINMIENGYIIFPVMRKDDEVTVSVRLQCAIKKEMLCGEEITVKWIGNKVKDVLPRGKNIPLYTGETL